MGNESSSSVFDEKTTITTTQRSKQVPVQTTKEYMEIYTKLGHVLKKVFDDLIVTANTVDYTTPPTIPIASLVNLNRRHFDAFPPDCLTFLGNQFYVELGRRLSKDVYQVLEDMLRNDRGRQFRKFGDRKSKRYNVSDAPAQSRQQSSPAVVNGSLEGRDFMLKEQHVNVSNPNTDTHTCAQSVDETPDPRHQPQAQAATNPMPQRQNDEDEDTIHSSTPSGTSSNTRDYSDTGSAGDAANVIQPPTSAVPSSAAPAPEKSNPNNDASDPKNGSKRRPKTRKTRYLKDGTELCSVHLVNGMFARDTRQLAHLDEYQHSNPVPLALFLMIFFIVGMVVLRFTQSTAEPKKRSRKAKTMKTEERNSRSL